MPLAWVPNVLLPHVRAIRGSADTSLRVAALQGDDVPPAYRLLVMLSSSVPAGYQAFGGPEWALASDPAHPSVG